MKKSVYKNHNEARVVGISPSSGYELMHQPDFPVLRVGSREVRDEVHGQLFLSAQ